MSFFGIPINLSEAWLVIVFAGGGALWSAHELRKAVLHKRIGFKGREYHQVDHRIEFNLYRGLWVVILFCSVAALMGWYFELEMKP
ncbi:hypothetical protein [Qipengyuania sp. YIM B01966]|uniref:hypothetical protein n=1 Tax=Qipengyuania sp. YIM B01966 TaxID=2778646 RepID=UPI0018F40D14|nr:hypothetical protein [Qipengyuania sp. YIM B01966]